jgi:hypothetical protein
MTCASLTISALALIAYTRVSKMNRHGLFFNVSVKIDYRTKRSNSGSLKKTS